MNLFKLILIYIFFFISSNFFFSNIKDINAMGQGYIYLGLSIVIFFIIFVMSITFYKLLVYKKSAISLSILLFYILINMFIDTWDLHFIKATLLGTTNGIVFSLLFGFMYAFLLSELFNLILRKRLYLSISIVMAIVVVIYCIYFSVDALQFNLASVRSDIFLIANQEGNYQRPGALMLMLYLFVVSLFSVLYIANNKFNFKIFVLFILTTILGILFMIHSQLIGSNSGLASIAGILVVMYIFTLLNSRKNSFNRSLTIKNIIFGKIGKKFILYSIVSLFTIVLFLFILINTYDLELSSFRIFGFGSEGMTSVDSRIRIFQDNFITQFSFNPIFGNTIVDTLTTGTGSYVHSLLSVFTHLGIVGFFLFSFLIVTIYKEIIATEPFSLFLYSNRQYGLYRILILSIVLLFALVSSMYVWMPLWFTIGLVGINLYMKEDKLNCKENKN